MYLIQIDPDTGLIADTPTNTGWRAIKAFRDFEKKKGLKGMTVVALTADYLSILSHYKENDRAQRANEEIYGKRNAIDFNDIFAAAALEKYKELQMDPDLETERINKEIKIRLIEKMNDANRNEDDSAIEKFRKSLADHENSIQSFNKRFDKKAAIEKAVTSTGYELTRIEADIKSRKKSKFVNHGEDVINPKQIEF